MLDRRNKAYRDTNQEPIVLFFLTVHVVSSVLLHYNNYKINSHARAAPVISYIQTNKFP